METSLFMDNLIFHLIYKHVSEIYSNDCRYVYNFLF